MTIGDQIQYARLQHNLTIPELARRASVSISYLYAIEAGVRGSHIDKIWRIANVLSLSLDVMCEEAFGLRISPVME